MRIRFDQRVAIVTGAGAGLGRCYALGLAARGARVVVNDHSEEAAQETSVVIQEAGGDAIAFPADVADLVRVEAMIAETIRKWGRIDILVNNAGILRDRSYAKMTLDEWNHVIRVHLAGSAICTKAVWQHMRDANYGRIVFTGSPSGLYGNFGQANYSAAKMGLIGLMNTLRLEGARNDIRVNVIVPGAATGMTEELLPYGVAELMGPEKVAPGLLYLVSDDAPSGVILNATAGGFSRSYIQESDVIMLTGDDLSPEGVASAWERISDPERMSGFEQGMQQVMRFTARAAALVTNKDY